MGVQDRRATKGKEVKPEQSPGLLTFLTPQDKAVLGTRGGQIPSEEQILSIRKPDHNQFGSADMRTTKLSTDTVEGNRSVRKPGNR